MSKYIDADKLKRHYAWWEDGTYEMTLDEAREAFDEIIDQQPAADVAEVKRGRWKGAGMGDYNCSLCGHLQSGKTPYCPNCGSRMDIKSSQGKLFDEVKRIKDGLKEMVE